MTYSLEMNNGEILNPRSLSDVLDAVEDCMGVDVRQYLEEAMEEGVPETVTEDEHLQDVLCSLQWKLRSAEEALSGKKASTHVALQEIEAMKSIIRRELHEGD